MELTSCWLKKIIFIGKGRIFVVLEKFRSSFKHIGVLKTNTVKRLLTSVICSFLKHLLAYL